MDDPFDPGNGPARPGEPERPDQEATATPDEATHSDEDTDHGERGDRYSVREVARIFNLTESRLRYWAQTGFINPSIRQGSRVFYTFFDLIGIRTAKDLLDSGLSLQKVRKNLQSLRELLPDVDCPLSRLRVRSDGERLLVEADDAEFEPQSKQLLLDVSTVTLKDQVARVLNLGRPVVGRRQPHPSSGATAGARHPTTARKPAHLPRHQTAYRWFVEGLAMEEGGEGKKEDLDGAADCYRKALALDPSLAAAHTNLGNVYYRGSSIADARAHYERALALDPEQPEARFNLANIYDQEGRLELAIAEYRRVINANPSFPDAYFNLGLCLERVGSKVQARECFEKYLELETEKDGIWARLARDHLAALTSST
jgi:DNA-binding transcriptional MerR regulator